MGIATAAAIGGTAIAAFGAVKSGIAGGKAADAQGRIAQAQEAAAQKAAQFSTPTAEELTTLNNQVNLYSTAHSNAVSQLDSLQKEITDTYGANIIEQGNQLHAELTGAASKITQNTAQQIERQRVQYQQQLVDKLGPGALTSSAGIQAMNAFNMQANTTLVNTQESSLNSMVQRLGNLQGGQSQAVSGINNINASLSGMLGQIQNTQNMFQQRQISAWGMAAGFAGSNDVGALQNARNDAQFGQSLTSFGGQLLGAGIGGMVSNAQAASKATSAGFSADNMDLSGSDKLTMNGLSSGGFNSQSSNYGGLNSGLSFSNMSSAPSQTAALKSMGTASGSSFSGGATRDPYQRTGAGKPVF